MTKYTIKIKYLEATYYQESENPMKYIDRIKNKITGYSYNEIIPFHEIKLEDISTNTLSKILHRLHDRGFVTIVKRGYFKREKPFDELLFVYGTMKKNSRDNKLLNRYSKRLGKAITIEKYGLFEDNSNNLPYLINEKCNRIRGEIYQIFRRETIEKIDKFKNVPLEHTREKILVKSHHGIQEAFVYFKVKTSTSSSKNSLKEWIIQEEKKVNDYD